ncbi:MAG: hypothetical protein H6742_04470 [Alphaproteobacteria bacterium]|nr:hypothetical protein [Alphaproteobacteria bacterium]
MNTALRIPSVKVPRLELDGDGVRVVRWGELDGCVLRPGDRLRLSADGAGPVLLAPRGRGRPMLAERQGSRLLALPARVPVGMVRWRAVGVVQAVERYLERGAPGGRFHVAVRLEPLHADADVLGAAASLPSGLVDGAQLDALCLRATLAPRRFGVAVAVAAADSAQRAAALLPDTAAEHLCFTLPTCAPLATVLVGPWPASSAAGDDLQGPTAPAPAPTVWASAAGTRQDRRASRRAPAADPQVLLPFADDTRRSA